MHRVVRHCVAAVVCSVLPARHGVDHENGPACLTNAGLDISQQFISPLIREPVNHSVTAGAKRPQVVRCHRSRLGISHNMRHIEEAVAKLVEFLFGKLRRRTSGPSSCILSTEAALAISQRYYNPFVIALGMGDPASVKFIAWVHLLRSSLHRLNN